MQVYCAQATNLGPSKFLFTIMQNCYLISPQGLSRENATQIAYDYIFEDVAGGEISWPPCLENGSLDLFMAIVSVRDFLAPLMPETCTLSALAEQPGGCVPVLYAILQEYEREHEQNEEKTPEALPRLFSLSPQPSFHQRFVTINAKALRALVHMPKKKKPMTMKEIWTILMPYSIWISMVFGGRTSIVSSVR